MAAAQHSSRPYPPIYHTPQSNSPASVSSPSGHESHHRSLYGQAGPPPPVMPSAMYGYQHSYSSMPSSAPSYGHAGSGQPPPSVLNPQPPQQPLMMPSPSTASALSHPTSHPLTHAHPHSQSSVAESPRTKMAQPPMQRPATASTSTAPSAGPPAPLAPQGSVGSAAAAGLPGTTSGPGGSSSGTGANANAAPGPIPATTPLVVRQDHNGVQWIAFEYSRDRVKMEYQIRCDVESVNVDRLSAEFKTDNCVYPRACCAKEEYRGNRLVYETECNTVGWALAELNPPLRGKRGLIQRAVDSWRNSNQDPRLRSRRVRRMAKVGHRKSGASAAPPHGGPPGGPNSAGSVGGGGMGIGPAGMKPGAGMGGGQLHHHAPPAAGTTEDLTASGAYDSSPQHHHHGAPNGSTTTSPTDVHRSRQIFHGYPPHFPNDAGVTVSALPPATYDAMAHLGAHASSNPTAIATATPKGVQERNTELFGDLPEAKRRKFILVDDPDRGARVRVRVMLDQVDMREIPDSYRKGNSVFPRSYFPMQMQSPRGRRFFPDDDDDTAMDGTDDSTRSVGRTIVPVPTLDGTGTELAIPRIGRAKRKKEEALNDLGYRMSWSQSRVFAGRTMFLQRALDAYRNKIRSTMLADGQDVTHSAPHFETRVGKRRWQDRTRRSGRATTP
ncbi:MAG: hypothetical protein M1823_005807 [Watsoniomyces obsoletus]|nr:MAG: hypothetical protein M1823_005807 [Watsoniomyces obsoletus]